RTTSRSAKRSTRCAPSLAAASPAAHESRLKAGSDLGRADAKTPKLAEFWGFLRLLATELLEFGGRQAQQPASHHQLLNLLSPLEDVQDLAVACPLLEQCL